MQNDPNLVKVCVNVDKTDYLHTINKSLPLSKIVEDLCKNYKKEVYTSYGLQILQPNNEYVYVTEENFNLIVHGSLLKLLPSIDYMLKSIFSATSEHDERVKYIWLRKLSIDKAFVRHITRDNLSSLITSALTCMGENLLNILQGLHNILQHTKINFITDDFIIFLINYCKNTSDSQDLQLMSIILQLLGQISVKYNHTAFIYNKLQISDLIPFLWRDEHTNIQLHTLFLINSYVKIQHDKSDIIEELNSQQYKSIIAKYVLCNAEENGELAHQVYVYQTYVLSKYSNYYNEQVLIGSDDSLTLSPRTSKEIYSLEEKNNLVDFEEINKNRKSGCSSIFDMGSGNHSPSISEANYFTNNIKFNDVNSQNNKTLPVLMPTVISRLTSLCLDYFKRRYKKNYTVSIVELNHEPGYYTVANQVMNMICKILSIGNEPDDNCTLYYPLVFICIDKKIFVEELFARALWLLAKTRREMKAKTLEDHSKVLAVLEEQIKLALSTKPTEYKQLTENLKKYTYDKVYDLWEEQREKSWRNNLKNNPNLDELREKFMQLNEKLIEQQRLSVLKEGGTFPKLPEKKGKQQYWNIKLSCSNKTLVYGDFDMECGDLKPLMNEIAISDINHVVFGCVSPHVKDHRIRKPEHFPRCFSLLLKDEGSIDFFADTTDIANTWIDGLHALIGKPMSSDLYKKELEQLVEMDLNLHLLEIQDVPLSMDPPPEIPPVPNGFEKPNPPPKPNKVFATRKTIVLQQLQESEA